MESILGSPYVYKYYPDNQYLIETLIMRTLYFSEPKTFNDPFDCKPDFNFEKTEENIRIFANSDKVSHFIDKLHFKDGYSLRNYKNFISTLLSYIRICCFSKNYDYELLWAHYANSSKGVCLKFNWIVSKDTFVIPQEIKYVEKRPKLDLIKSFEDWSGGDFENQLVTCKSKQWSYEQEVRVVKWVNTTNESVRIDYDNKFQFAPKSLTDVYLGHRMEKSFKDLVLEILKTPGYEHVNIHQMEADEQHFKLNSTILKKGVEPL